MTVEKEREDGRMELIWNVIRIMRKIKWEERK